MINLDGNLAAIVPPHEYSYANARFPRHNRPYRAEQRRLRSGILRLRVVHFNQYKIQ